MAKTLGITPGAGRRRRLRRRLLLILLIVGLVGYFAWPRNSGPANVVQYKTQEAKRGDLVVVEHATNRGKGAAVQSGLRAVSGDIVVVQDADLEYDPQDYEVLMRPLLAGRSKVVYGSRFLGEHRAMRFWHSVGNKALTLVTNLLYDTTLTDMETCYKMFTADVARRITPLREPRWGFDPEITARILRAGYRIYEVPISYAGREYIEGKKISWRDGFVVLRTLIRCRFTS